MPTSDDALAARNPSGMVAAAFSAEVRPISSVGAKLIVYLVGLMPAAGLKQVQSCLCCTDCIQWPDASLRVQQISHSQTLHHGLQTCIRGASGGSM